MPNHSVQIDFVILLKYYDLLMIVKLRFESVCDELINLVVTIRCHGHIIVMENK